MSLLSCLFKFANELKSNHDVYIYLTLNRIFSEPTFHVLYLPSPLVYPHCKEIWMNLGYALTPTKTTDHNSCHLVLACGINKLPHTSIQLFLKNCIFLAGCYLTVNILLIKFALIWESISMCTYWEGSLTICGPETESRNHVLNCFTRT
jgi:hypothetical protein